MVDEIVEEYESIANNCAWEGVPGPTYKLIVGLRWIIKVEKEIDGIIGKYKARFVAMGYYQV